MGWLDSISAAIAVADELKNVDLKSKLADVKMACVDLAEENVRLREERNDLREQLRRRTEMKFDQNVYWQEGPDGKRDGPFCPGCRDGQGKTARMAERPDDHYWRCTVCTKTVEKPGRDPRLDQPRSLSLGRDPSTGY